MSEARARRYVSTREAAFIGVASMVGAGIFSLLGTAGEVAGTAVWLSFILAGAIAALQGYSFAKLGSKYPTAGGLLEYVNRGYGMGHVATITAWLTYAANAIVTAMVAMSFGSYAASAFGSTDLALTKAFAVGLVVLMTVLNVLGSTVVARVQSLIVFIVVGILGLFALVTILNMDASKIAPSTYPGARDIVSSIALTFFAFLGFGVVTFTAKDLRDPSRQLPRAMAIAIGLATVVYVAVALGVFGTLSVDEVIAAGPTAIAVAAKPVLGDVGYWLMTVTALFATAGATNAGLYPASGLSEELASTGQFPPVMGRRLREQLPVGLLVAAITVVILVLGHDLSAIASIGSAVALGIFCLVTIGHLRIYRKTGARLSLLVVALATAGIALITFVFTTLIQEPASIVTLAIILVIAFLLDLGWSRPRPEPVAEPA
ncbi:MAG TPA: APC family permease [Candidatus Limnocylindrales bacterium]|nr:APC family permease [Candidatus Limnocylindrales bacterium]